MLAIGLQATTTVRETLPEHVIIGIGGIATWRDETGALLRRRSFHFWQKKGWAEVEEFLAPGKYRIEVERPDGRVVRVPFEVSKAPAKSPIPVDLRKAR